MADYSHHLLVYLYLRPCYPLVCPLVCYHGLVFHLATVLESDVVAEEALHSEAWVAVEVVWDFAPWVAEAGYAAAAVSVVVLAAVVEVDVVVVCLVPL